MLALFGVKDRLRAVGGPISAGLTARSNNSGMNAGIVPAEIDVLDAAGDLRLGRLGELQFVEDVAGDLGVLVGIPQAVERRRSDRPGLVRSIPDGWPAGRMPSSPSQSAR